MSSTALVDFSPTTLSFTHLNDSRHGGHPNHTHTLAHTPNKLALNDGCQMSVLDGSENMLCLLLDIRCATDGWWYHEPLLHVVHNPRTFSQFAFSCILFAAEFLRHDVCFSFTPNSFLWPTVSAFTVYIRVCVCVCVINRNGRTSEPHYFNANNKFDEK